MQLVADRFAVGDAGRVVDLATGDSVVLTIAAAGGCAEQTRWAVRCDALQKLHHPAIAPMVDYGAVGESQRFEAWACGSPWGGARADAERVVSEARLFLRACGLTAGACTWRGVYHWAGRAVVLPDAETGYPGDPTAENSHTGNGIAPCGLAHLERRAVSAIAELFDATGPRPQIVALWGPIGSGKTSVVSELARVARLKGFVPLSVRLLGSRWADAVGGRTFFLIDDEASTGWRSLLDGAIRWPRPHVLLFAAVDDIRAVQGLALEPLSADALAAAIRPIRRSPSVEQRVRRALQQADGLPGRLARLLWRDKACAGDGPAKAGRHDGSDGGWRDGPAEGGRHVTSAGGGWLAAEQPAVYGSDEIAEILPAGPSDARGWPDPGELAALRRRMDGAMRQLETGRHAPGDRELRVAIGSLARRDDWTHAGRGALALAASLLKRGRTRDAQTTLDEARGHCARAGGEESPLVDVATLAGVAWTDLARLDEAESVLAAALATARSHGDAARVASAALALARCLFWRGRYADADQLLAPPMGVALTDGTAVRFAAMTSRVAVGVRDFSRAVSSAADAVQRAQALGGTGLQAEAACAAAFAHLAVGDLDAVERDVATSVAAARAAHDPLRAIRARLILAERARRSSRRPTAAALLTRLKNVATGSLPPIVRARCDLLNELVSASTPASAIAARHVAATGLTALTLFLPATDAAGRSAGAFEMVVDDLVDILGVCQSAEEESTVLKTVCERLQRQLRAASIAFFGVDGASHVLIASEGGRVEYGIAERAMTSGIPIAPHRCEDRIEAAAPVRYGGRTIGVVAARWALGASHDLSRAASVLTMAAAAAAPAVSAAVARRVQATNPAVTELLGIGTAIAEVRRAVERAASAPFAVLIEGETGSGKELVARALHRSGPRRDRPICTLNCAALPEELVESELFGHARGAFTGAVAERPGVFEEAHTGTLFLDEIGELSLRAQAKVLRVVQDGELRRIGENVSRRIDVRIVAATNRDLRQEAAAARFRLDLLYRLDVIRIVVPPLRDRPEDIALLVEHFWREATGRIGSRATLGAATAAALARYDWPGNVRELQNVLAALAVRSPKRGVVPATALPPQFGETRPTENWRLEEARRTFEERFIRAALVRTGGRRTQAAVELGVTRQGLTKLMRRLGISSSQ